MRNKMQIKDIKNNIDEIYNRLAEENRDDELINEMMNDIERLTYKLLEVCS